MVHLWWPEVTVSEAGGSLLLCLSSAFGFLQKGHFSEYHWGINTVRLLSPLQSGYLYPGLILVQRLLGSFLQSG